ncbi:chaperone for protein-folding within the ER, fungal-domain-containing protein [Armillaria borealis]|uniref:Protein ROT1 n=1 Tax=Armillaria borealis TaxID=47425 RepID=A0AA39JXW5_9AGAR|nr:chaperone for protein-folding within the ER, fungal-domain-containing protein [Armillaria borealis]
MIFNPLIALVLAVLPAHIFAQDIVYDPTHNMTVITGTWATGSKAVQTGSGFAIPSNESFIYPSVTGMSFSFADNMWFEVARYRFNANATDPGCITGVVGWSHGTYSLEPNGSIILTPNGDGYQQIQDPCAAISNFVENYNDTELYQSWRIFQDPTDGFKLHLFAFDGSPLPPMFQVSTTPQMLPTQKLRNTTAATTTASSRKRSLLRRNTNAGVSSTACLAVTGGAWVVSLLALAL